MEASTCVRSKGGASTLLHSVPVLYILRPAERQKAFHQPTSIHHMYTTHEPLAPIIITQVRTVTPGCVLAYALAVWSRVQAIRSGSQLQKGSWARTHWPQLW